MLTRVLTGSLGVDPIAANIVSILACGALNFGASEWLVFRRAAAAAVIVLTVQPMFAAAPADDLGPSTFARTRCRPGRPTSSASTRATKGPAPPRPPFFALDAFGAQDWRRPPCAAARAMSRIASARPGDGATRHRGRQDSPLGRGHLRARRVGGRVLKQLADLAGHEQQHYEDVLASRLLARDDDRYRIFMKIRRSKIITVTYNTEHDVQLPPLGSARASARSVATRIAQLDDAGTPQERELKVGSDSGLSLATERLLALRSGQRRRVDRVRVGEPEPRHPVRAAAVRHRRSKGVARESLERTLVGLRRYLTAR